MTNKELAQMLRSAASALEHGRQRTARTKVKSVAQALHLGLAEPDIEALLFALDLAFDDQDDYLRSGNAAIDYGSEWNDAADLKMKYFRNLAIVAERLGSDGDKWGELANMVQAMKNTNERTICECGRYDEECTFGTNGSEEHHNR